LAAAQHGRAKSEARKSECFDEPFANLKARSHLQGNIQMTKILAIKIGGFLKGYEAPSFRHSG
jgi:hypothetical protein